MGMTVDYLGHSGFLFETEAVLILFDYYVGDLSIVSRKSQDKPVFALVSHFHADHYNPEIFSLRESGRDVKYILSYDLRRRRKIPEDADFRFIKPGETIELPGLGRVSAFQSTDIGVAYLVDTGSERIFHAGDLNWWYWEGEEPRWLSGQEKVFKREIKKLAGIKLDAACVVVDDRLGEYYSKGPEYFLSVCRPAHLFPMHFTQDREIARKLKALPGLDYTGTVIHDTPYEDHWEI